MNRHPSDDRRLADLLADAVADVTPPERLDDIRSRTSNHRAGRPWLVAGGAALAAAAVVTAVALATSGPAPTARPGPAGTPHVSVSPAPSDAGSPEESPPTSAPVSTTADMVVPAYFVGDTPTGPRLYREFERQSSTAAPGWAGLEALEAGPQDPDYRSEWPAGSFERLSDPEAGTVHVFLAGAAPADPSALAQQQVVYTVSAGFQESLSVVFHRSGEVSDPVAAAPPLDVKSLVNLSDPSEGQLAADALHVKGVANSNEANVVWEVRQGEQTVQQGHFTAEGWMGTKLFPFSGSVDVSSLDPGSYTLIVETDDPSGGAEGPGAYSDTRTFVIE